MSQHRSADSGRMFRWTVALLISSGMAPRLAIGSCQLRQTRPEVAVPGATHLILDSATHGYAICTCVRRYFEDEKPVDLRSELDLMARHQLARLLMTGQDKVKSGSFIFRGFELCETWWEGDYLVGLYFIPATGIEEAPQEKPSPAKESSSAAELLLRGRELKKEGKLEEAKATFEEIREHFALTPQARRALHEIYLVESLIKERNFQRRPK